jgi:mannan endo-1,4-beta-mannosidase
MLHSIVTAFLQPGGPYLYVRLVTASYAISAIARMIPVKPRQVPGDRPRVPAVVWYGGSTAVALAAVACAFVFSPATAPVAHPARRLAAAPKPVRAGFHLGVFEPGETVSYQPVTTFATAVGREPDLVPYYSGWGEPFLTQFAETAYAHGAEPIVQIYPPAHGSLAAIAAGSGDRYLRWGWTRTPAATWAAAWRHLVTVFRAAGATNASWMLTLNIGFEGSGPVPDYWPGASYVDWVGIDGYYISPRDTFGSRFLSTVQAVRKITGKPLVISETAVGPAAGQARGISDLFAAIPRYRLTGLIWFDERQNGGVHHQDWRLEDDPQAVIEFRREATAYGRPLPSARSGG